MEWMDCGQEEALLKECQWAEEHPAPYVLEMIITRMEEECRWYRPGCDVASGPLVFICCYGCC